MLRRTLQQVSESCSRTLMSPHAQAQQLAPSFLERAAYQLSSLELWRSHKSAAVDSSVQRISVTFFDEKDQTESTVLVPVGENLLEAAHDNNVDLEGACEGSLACSTCHVIVEDEEMFDKLPEPEDDENDMLDLAYGLKETSRLGCQIIAAPELDGLRVRIPSATRNFAVDGYVPKPH